MSGQCKHHTRFIEWEDHSKPISCVKCRLAAAEKEITAWRASFPIMEVKPGALFASTKAEYELQDE